MRFATVFLPAVLLFSLLLTACQPAPRVPGDASSPASGIHNMPVPTGVAAARTALAARLNVDVASILILEAHEAEWSDSCLGLGGPAESCLQVITPGYAVLMTYEGTGYRYRTNTEGTIVRAEE